MPANVDNKAESKPKKSAVPDAIVIPAASTTSPKSPRPDIAAGLGIFSPRVSEDVKIADQQEERRRRRGIESSGCSRKSNACKRRRPAHA